MSLKKNKIKHFLSVALKDFSHIGAIFPSSRWAAQKVIRALPQRPKVVIEYGPGIGTVSQYLLSALGPDGKLFGIEVNPDFVRELGQITDSRFHLIAGDVVAWSARLKELSPEGFDAAVSGIPFSFLTPEQRQIVARNTFQAMRPGGRCVLYQNTLHAYRPLKEAFGNIKMGFEVRNIFPYFVMVAEKK